MLEFLNLRHHVLAQIQSEQIDYQDYAGRNFSDIHGALDEQLKWS